MTDFYLETSSRSAAGGEAIGFKLPAPLILTYRRWLHPTNDVLNHISRRARNEDAKFATR